jgi:D-sedoheptulose 7-phosphate isomerase
MASIQERFCEHQVAVEAALGELAGPIAEAVQVVVRSLKGGGGVYLFGNGGSASDAQHIAGELVGRFEADRPSLRAVALTSDAAAVTAIANDYGFDQVFARQLSGLARAGDVAVGLSTSGGSENVVAALEWAKSNGLQVVTLTGAPGGRCAELSDVSLAIPSTRTATVQEVVMIVYHILCEQIEAAFVR